MSNVLLAPGTLNIKFSLDPVYNNLASLSMVALADTFPDLDEWVRQTAANLSAEQMRVHRVLFDILYSAFEPNEDWPSFPAYLDHLGKHDPMLMRNRFLKHMFACSSEHYTQRDRIMDLETFIAQIGRSEFDREIEYDLFAQAHAFLNNPPTMRDTIVSHLTMMWHEALRAEWERTKEFLMHTIDTFRNHDYSNQSAYEAIRAVTGRDAHGNWQQILASTETLIFIPSPHIGPYLMHYAYVPVVRMIFGARLPEQVLRAPIEFTRTDILIQLRTLADDTRLRILELLLKEGELCAQDIITRLELSKSSASRHLSQLSATGYLVEHSRSGKTKCYTLNPERFQETIHFLRRYTTPQ
jgi:DNA-binding transcriptional ArsR family regulator